MTKLPIYFFLKDFFLIQDEVSMTFIIDRDKALG